MALSVTPPSGDAPYVFDFDIVDKYLLGTGVYSAEVRMSTGVGSCPTVTRSSNIAPGGQSAVLTGNTYTVNTTVPDGSCMSLAIFIIRLSDDVVLSQQQASVSNIE